MPSRKDRTSLEDEVSGILQQLQQLQGRIQSQAAELERAETFVAQAQTKAEAASAAAAESTEAARAALAALRKTQVRS